MEILCFLNILHSLLCSVWYANQYQFNVKDLIVVMSKNPNSGDSKILRNLDIQLSFNSTQATTTDLKMHFRSIDSSQTSWQFLLHASLFTAAAAVTGLPLHFLVQFYIRFLKRTASCLTLVVLLFNALQPTCILFL